MKGRQRSDFKIRKHIGIKIQVLPNGTRSLLGKSSALEKPRTWVRDLASVRFFPLFRCVLSSLLPLRSVGRSNFDMGLHNLTTLIKKRHILMRTAVCIYIYIYIHIYIYLYVPDEGSLLPKYRDGTTSNDFELYLMCCGVMLQ